MKLKWLAIFLICIFSTSSFARISFSGCSPSEVKDIQAAHDSVNHRLNEVLDPRTGVPTFTLNYILENKVKADSLIPSQKFKNHNTTYRTFHSKVSSALTLMKNKMNNGFIYKCMPERERRCAPATGVQAYVLFIFNRPYNRIHFCPIFFDGDSREKENTIMHELSHLAALTDHYMGTIFSDEGMIASTNDAYLYGQIMHTPLEQFWKRSSWGFIWNKTGR